MDKEKCLVEQSLMDGVGKKLINSVYEYNGNPVPRVSNILDTAIGNKELIDWAASINKSSYEYIRDSALETGTITHEAIDDYLSGIKDFYERIDKKSFNTKITGMAKQAVKNFLHWESYINNFGYMIDEIIGLEIPIITPWYGGTTDAILRINGAVYLIDFKTSKQISFTYPLQASAYALGINSGYSDIKIKIDGIGIIRVDKYKDAFDDYFLNYHIPNQADQLNQYTNAFISILNSYYHINNTKVLNKDYRIGLIENEPGE